MFAFIVLGLVSSVLSQQIGWEERLRNMMPTGEWKGQCPGVRNGQGPAATKH